MHRANPSGQTISESESMLAATPANDGFEPVRRRTWGLDQHQELAEWDLEPSDTLPEMELAVGISDWIDPQTGSPAEGQSPLHSEFE
jgi:hypothetical protein